jgi:hypothetical protein
MRPIAGWASLAGSTGLMAYVEGPRTKHRLDTDGSTLCALSACIVVAAFRAEIPLEPPQFSEFLVSQLARRLSPHEVGDALEPPQFSEFLVSELARLLPPPELGEALGLAETTHVSICRMPKTTSALTCCSAYTSTCCFFMAPGASVQSIESPACELTDASHLSLLCIARDTQQGFLVPLQIDRWNAACLGDGGRDFHEEIVQEVGVIFGFE